MRVVAGELKGMVLAGPGKKADFRPTEDRVREALFSILGRPASATSFLDLFAGSGAVGLEALSRGFAPVWVVENSRRALSILRRNIETLKRRSGAPEPPLVVSRDVRRFLQSAPRAFDVIYCDPPYRDVRDDFLPRLLASAPLQPTGVLVLEHGAKVRLPDFPPGFRRSRHVRYGTCALSFYRPVTGGTK